MTTAIVSLLDICVYFTNSENSGTVLVINKDIYLDNIQLWRKSGIFNVPTAVANLLNKFSPAGREVTEPSSAVRRRHIGIKQVMLGLFPFYCFPIILYVNFYKFNQFMLSKIDKLQRE